MMRRQDKVGTGLGLLVAPLVFGLYLAVTESEGGGGDDAVGRGGGTTAVGAGDRYDVRLRCLDEESVYQRARLRAASHGDALASAEARNPGCKAVSAERARG